ncbi:MAG: hypothetical protein WCS74_04570 [Dehalococcoidales bacterium]|nr:hypothetical protein [Dehalococcoidales bacterium]MDD3265083.1 hypothetical protein [Dehalococcoidales bacterium]MDD4322436.1 hypothetical protein [Dehalococcoidales bacterium]MDD4793990.1 hypothetical protein [Dehalococcoidales bacterium]MDD5122678.1 hypothetical protein [Dehalococcoidales bacterium]
MSDSNKELIQLLKEINEKLDVIKYDIKDVKNAMPKVPYYGDMLEDIERAVKDLGIKK